MFFQHIILSKTHRVLEKLILKSIRNYLVPPASSNAKVLEIYTYKIRKKSYFWLIDFLGNTIYNNDNLRVSQMIATIDFIVLK